MYTSIQLTVTGTNNYLSAADMLTPQLPKSGKNYLPKTEQHTLQRVWVKTFCGGGNL
jgi:hypothetical protein